MKTKLKTILKNINNYFIDDYGIDFIKVYHSTYKFITESIVIRIIFDFLILIFGIILAIGWAGSVFALALSHPIIIILHLIISILLLLFALEPEYVYELIKRN